MSSILPTRRAAWCKVSWHFVGEKCTYEKWWSETAQNGTVKTTGIDYFFQFCMQTNRVSQYISVFPFFHQEEKAFCVWGRSFSGTGRPEGLWVSILGDLCVLTGHGPGQRAVAEPAWAGLAWGSSRVAASHSPPGFCALAERPGMARVTTPWSLTPTCCQGKGCSRDEKMRRPLAGFLICQHPQV